MKIHFTDSDRGYTLAGALVLLAIMAIFLALAVPLWSRVKQRDNEEELIFRGNEYIKAIARYHAKFNTYPPDLETLVKLKYLRHEYPDPMTKSGKWKVLHPDALAQTGAAGTINNPNQDKQKFGGFNDTQDDEKGKKKKHKNRDSLGDDDDDDDDDTPGLSSDDDEKNKEEEPEVESVGPVVGVVSRSKKPSMKILNGQNFYNKWTFVYALQQQQRGAQPQQPPRGQNGTVNPQQNQQNRGFNTGGGMQQNQQNQFQQNPSLQYPNPNPNPNLQNPNQQNPDPNKQNPNPQGQNPIPQQDNDDDDDDDGGDLQL